MSNVRAPAVSGLFYPANANELQSAVQDYIGHNQKLSPPPKAIIAPHAGFIYSGPIAGSAYSCVSQLAGVIRKVILLGPTHRVAVRGIATVDASYFSTPLGSLKIDRDGLNTVHQFDYVEPVDLAHKDEHCLEVQLPFIQVALGEVEILPLLVGQCTIEQVADVIESVWGGPETLIIVSSDLSHFHDYDTAKQIDNQTNQAILGLNTTPIGFDQACGSLPLCGLLRAADHHQLDVSLLDIRNSGDTAGDKSRVVGYAAYAFYPQ